MTTAPLSHLVHEVVQSEALILLRRLCPRCWWLPWFHIARLMTRVLVRRLVLLLLALLGLLPA